MRYLVLTSAILLAGCGRNTPVPETVEANSTPKGVLVAEASYGQNCRDFEVAPPAVNSVAPGNATTSVVATCQQGAAQLQSCSYTVDANVLGDPAPGCEKDFEVAWKCGNATTSKKLDAEANGKTIEISCE